MSQATDEPLNEFPATSTKEWRELVEESLKGASFEKKLHTKRHDGFSVAPLYDRANCTVQDGGEGYPGFFPFVRGVTPQGADGRGWAISQEHAHPDVAVTKAAIATEFKQGADAVVLRFDRATRAGLDSDSPAADAGVDGVMGCAAAQLSSLLPEGGLESQSVTLNAGAHSATVAALWFAALQEQGISPGFVRGVICCDPLGVLATEGSLPHSIEESLEELAGVAAWAKDQAPELKTVLVSSAPVHNAGGSAAQEIAYALSAGLAYLRAMEAAGLTLEEALGQMQFSFSTGRDFFTGIAKFRAARLCWAKVFAACGGTPEQFQMNIHARTSAYTKTKNDPWANMLRTTVEGFASAAGGADSLSTSPFDEALGLPDPFSRRIALNSQVLLKEESHLRRVTDPAGGSWYIESLTDQLARAAWASFQACESAGGMVPALLNGVLAEQVREVSAAKELAIARRKDAITGVSEFANLEEEPLEKELPDLSSLREQAGKRLASHRTERDDKACQEKLEALKGVELISAMRMGMAIEAAQAGATLQEILSGRESQAVEAPALVPKREAQGFEALRAISDEVLAKTGKRPSIFLANLGPIPKHKARSGFAQNFAEAGGLQALTNDGFATAEEVGKAYQASGASLAILCSSDDVYEEMAADTARVLKEAGAKRVLLAGKPADPEALSAAGVDGYIFMGANVLEVVSDLLGSLGVMS